MIAREFRMKKSKIIFSAYSEICVSDDMKFCDESCQYFVDGDDMFWCAAFGNENIIKTKKGYCRVSKCIKSGKNAEKRI
jgi:hypothetical protein